MINNFFRIGRFNSSEIGALIKRAKDGKSFGSPALTYIAETNMEIRLGRSLTSDTFAKPLAWGNLVEGLVFDSLDIKYTLSSSDTVVHPNIPYWSGSPDGYTDDTVMDIKCPFTLKSFCQLVDPLYSGKDGIEAMNAIRAEHNDGDKYYWQLVSNAILMQKQYAELIIFMPFESQIEEIKTAANISGENSWVAFSKDGELPYIKDGGYYNNINIIRFEVPESDKELLTNSVLRAGEMLEGAASFQY